jgi:hypothetical protein
VEKGLYETYQNLRRASQTCRDLQDRVAELQHIHGIRNLDYARLAMKVHDANPWGVNPSWWGRWRMAGLQPDSLDWTCMSPVNQQTLQPAVQAQAAVEGQDQAAIEGVEVILLAAVFAGVVALE